MKKIKSKTLMALIDAINKGLPLQSLSAQGGCLCCGWERRDIKDPEEWEKALNAGNNIADAYFAHFGEKLETGTTTDLVSKKLEKELNLNKAKGEQVIFSRNGIYIAVQKL